MRTVVALALFIFLIPALYSQNSTKKDSLLAVLKAQRTVSKTPAFSDSLQIFTLRALAEQLELSNPDSLILLNEEALDLALKLRTLTGSDDPVQSKKIDVLVGNCYNELGFYHHEIGNYGAALDNYFKSEEIWKTLGPADGNSKWSYVLSEIGFAYGSRGDYTKALEYQFRGLQMDERLKNKSRIVTDLGNIGITYGTIGKDFKALEFFFKSLKIAEELGEKRSIGIKLGNIGLCYVNLGEYDKAMEYYLRSLKMAEEEGDKKGASIKRLNIGFLFKNQAEKIQSSDSLSYKKELLEKSLNYFAKARTVFEESRDKSGLTSCLQGMGEAFAMQKKYREAEEYLKRSLALAEETEALANIDETARKLSMFYSLIGQHELALHYYKKHIAARDSLFNEENTEKEIRSEVDYEYDKKVAVQKAEHEKEVLLLESEHKNNRNLVILVSIIAFLVLSAGFIYYTVRKNLRVKEEFARQLLATQEKERQRISKELHDSVGQNILFIKNQVTKLANEALITSVDEALEEVRTISKDLYPNQLEKYGLVAAVDALVEKFSESSGIFVSADVEGFKKEMLIEKQINFYRVVQECISNTLKHAAATALRITAVATNSGIELVIQDNGKGFEKQKLKQSAQKSFGVLNLEERMRLLNGTAELETSPGNGTKWRFFIPV